VRRWLYLLNKYHLRLWIRLLVKVEDINRRRVVMAAARQSRS